MEEEGTSRLARLKESLLQASSQANGAEGFAALQKSLNAVLDAHSRVKRGHGAAISAQQQERAKQFDETVSKARQQLQAKCEQLQAVVDDARAMVEDAGDHPIDPTPEGVKAVLAHSHKLAYTSFAPLLGMHLVDPSRGVYMPPFPQTIQLQQTFLKQYAHEKADAEAAKQAAEAAAAAAAAAAKAQPKEVPELKMNLPKIPRMPVGWKPGDPIPLPPEWNTGSLVPGPVPDKPAGLEPPVMPADVPLNVNLDLDAGIDDDFILNAEAVEMASDEDSSDAEDEDGEDAPPGTAGTADVEEEEGRMESDDD